MSVHDEIAKAIDGLGLSAEDITEVPPSDAAPLCARLEQHFTGRTGASWWWERFVLPSEGVHVEDGKGYARLTSLVPDPAEHVWWVVEGDGPFLIYDATTSAIQAVLGECYAFEYYLVAKDLGWLLCENHHDTLIAIGESVQERLS